jgi:hypothetical protein
MYPKLDWRLFDLATSSLAQHGLDSRPARSGGCAGLAAFVSMNARKKLHRNGSSRPMSDWA